MNLRKFNFLTKKFPLFLFILQSFVAIFMCQAYLKVSTTNELESIPEKADGIFVWSYKNPVVHGPVLQVSFKITSPLLSALSTTLLLFGMNEVNPYYFLPWLILTFRGLATVQVENLLTICRNLSLTKEEIEMFPVVSKDWKCLGFSAFIMIFSVTECYCFYKTVNIFRLYWKYKPYYMLNMEKEWKLDDKLQLQEKD